MKNSNQNFKALVTKMEQLKETEQGKLKGGIGTVGSATNAVGTNVSKCVTNYIACGSNIGNCGCTR
jgi:hypothetical protein